MNQTSRRLALPLILLLAGTAATAAPLRFHYEGRVCASTPGPDGAPWFDIGTPVAGHFTYNPDVPPDYVQGTPGEGQQATYFQIRPHAITLSVGGLHAVGKRLNTLVYDDVSGTDSVSIGAGSPTLNGQRVKHASLGLFLWTRDTTTLSGIGLPTQFDLARWQMPCDATYGWLDVGPPLHPQWVKWVIDAIVAE